MRLQNYTSTSLAHKRRVIFPIFDQLFYSVPNFRHLWVGVVTVVETSIGSDCRPSEQSVTYRFTTVLVFVVGGFSSGHELYCYKSPPGPPVCPVRNKSGLRQNGARSECRLISEYIDQIEIIWCHFLTRTITLTCQTEGSTWVPTACYCNSRQSWFQTSDDHPPKPVTAGRVTANGGEFMHALILILKCWWKLTWQVGLYKEVQRIPVSRCSGHEWNLLFWQGL